MNKRRGFFGMAGAGMLAVLSMLSGMKNTSAPVTIVGSGSHSLAQDNRQQKQTLPIQAPARNVIVEDIGGMPFTRVLPNYGMSPKEYGMQFGNGGSKKSNRLRYAHNAKVKRRNAC